MIPDETIARARDLAIADVAVMFGAEEGVRVAERGVPCPGCGGRDRFSVDPGKNVFLCRMSGAGGDPIALARHVANVGFAEAVRMLAGETALPARRQVQPEADNRYREKARQRAWAVWQTGRPIEPERGGRLVAAYLSLRGIPFPGWRIKALREIRELAYWHWSKSAQEFRIVHRGPAMLAAITGPDGRFIGVHRTWLDLARPNGKAAITDPETGETLAAKKVEGSQRGGKIELRDGCEWPDLVIGEGIETVLSWDAIHRAGTAALWCGVNLDNIAGKAVSTIPHPSLTRTDKLGRTLRVKVAGQEPDLADEGCLAVPASRFDRIVLLGDADSDRFTTQAAMLRAQHRLGAVGHLASIDWAPDGQDWNDVLKGMRAPLPAGRAIAPARAPMAEGVAA